MAVVTMKRLLESGVHFGHQTKRWDPRMKPYIFGVKNGIHVIDLQKSLHYIEESYKALRDLISEGGMVLFVGTKKQAQDAIESEAKRCGMPYVSHRWLGGMLTNFKTIKKRVETLKKLEKMEEEGAFDEMSKKEAIRLRKEKQKLSQVFEGIKEMDRVPDALFIVDTKKERNAIFEAKKLGIPIFAIVDTNCDPNEVDYIIPGNDDAIRAVKLITEVMANAVVEGLQTNLEGMEVNEEDAAEEVKAAASDENNDKE